MGFSFLLATMLALDPAPQGDFATFSQAVEAANDGRDAEALAAFQRLANMNPDDLDARLWIARLHVRMGHQDLAEPVYRSVLLEDPSDLEAMLGVANALLARGEVDEAEEILECRRRARAQNDEVLYAVGRSHYYSGRTVRAIEYFERAYARLADRPAPHVARRGAPVVPPSRRAARVERAIRRLDARHAVRRRDREHPPERSVARVRPRDRPSASSASRSSAAAAAPNGAGRQTTVLRGHALVMPDNIIMPEGDYMGELQYTYLDATWSGSVRYFDFTGARSTVISPAVQWTPAASRIAFGLRYALSLSESRPTSNPLVTADDRQP